MWMQLKMFLKSMVRKKNQNKFGSIKIFFLYLWKQNKTQMKKEQIIEKFFVRSVLPHISVERAVVESETGEIMDIAEGAF